MRLESGIKVLRAIAEPTRLRLVRVIGEGEIAVEELCAVLGQSQPRVSRHLRVLADAGLVTRFRDRHRVYYRVPRDAPAASLVRSILDTIDHQDAVLRADVRRSASVRAERERRALAMRDDEAQAGSALRPEARELSTTLDEILGGRPVGDLLDVGCGSGTLLCLLGARARRAVGIDTSEKMRLLARSRVQRAGLNHVTLRQGDMHDLPVEDESFDLVVLDEVFRCSDRPTRLLREARRVLRPGGTLLIYDRIARSSGSSPPESGSLSLPDVDRALDRSGLNRGLRTWLLGAAPDIALLVATRPLAAADTVTLRTGT